MKVYPDKLSESLHKSLAPLYLISGDELLLVNEAADQIRSSARKQGFLEREIFYTDNSGFDWENVLQTLNSLSLFSEKKIVEVHCTKQKPNHDGLFEYLERPNPDTVLILFSDKLDKTTQNSKWFKAIEAAGVFVQIWPLEAASFNRWLAQRAKNKGLHIDSEAIQLLHERTEGNLLAADQELEKLVLLFDRETVTAEKLARSVSNNARYDVFKLVDAALTGDGMHALKILNGLCEEGTALTVVLWALTRELRTLANISTALETGPRNDQLFIRHGVWEKRQPLFQQALKRLPAPRILQLLQQANQIDLSIKGLGNQNPRDALENLCLTLAGK